MTAFPLFLDLARRCCLVVGGGAVGCDKARQLAGAGAQVLVVEPEPSRELFDLAAASPAVTIEARLFEPGDCRGKLLVFTCTGDEAVNDAAAADAAACGALCCRSDGGAGGDFSTGAVLRRGDVCVAVSSGGASPALAAAARDLLAPVIGDEFAAAAEMLGRLRDQLQSCVPDGRARRAALRDAAAAELLGALREGRRADAEAVLARVLRRAIHAEENPCTR